MGVALIAHRFRQWRDAYRRDAIAILQQDAEAESIKREGLSHLGDRPSLMNHETSDRRRTIVGQFPFHDAIEITDGNATIDMD